MTSAPAVHVVVPDSFDDPLRPSGGNRYDQRVCAGLAASGRDVTVHPVRGAWPWPDPSARRELGGIVAAVPDGATLLLDGLIAGTSASELIPAVARQRLIVLVHLPVAHRQPAAEPGEREVLTAADSVITTSEWTRAWLMTRYGLAADRVVVARPGVDAAPGAEQTAEGTRLLCVAAVTPGKGQDVLIAALAELAQRAGPAGAPWHCRLVGPLDRDRAFVAAVSAAVDTAGLCGRVRLVGPRTPAALEREYAHADLLLLPSRYETYGMVITEALARGVPVVASAVGGVGEAIGDPTGVDRAGLLVPEGDPGALAAALSGWLSEPGIRRRWRSAARRRRGELTGWDETVRQVGDVLAPR
ncbi:glycosyltransferase family 4 protein [Jatrophihabitans telluris]|uniref:Glycosyltransferase family 4 protein n=1 Tax=Jatrophihabitans telluris TaxID=2038343 RepID=A0ABY4R251_9ACTN|nr:glycosyltransferase family 4 protein [Jatrophihabitans telluris]UQX89397.1 glycosyltransferase family 4 protein [Jatrophihabitans telluris]